MGAHRASLKAETPEKTLMEQQKKKKRAVTHAKPPNTVSGRQKLQSPTSGDAQRRAIDAGSGYHWQALAGIRG